ncbi:MAG TPA: SRPBCC family protein [Micromonosporaceae bacterium]
MSTDVVIVSRTINARPATVFSFFTDRDRWLSWQGLSAEIDARPGGSFRMNVRGDGWASGHFIAVDPYERIEFTWGWEGDDSPVPPGSSTVEVTLRPVGDDGTLLTLVHRGLPLPALDVHRDGWNHYLDRLTIRAAGGDPGRDTPSSPQPAAPTDAVKEPIKVVSCACGRQWRGTESQLIELVRQHGRDVHNMPATAEQVLAMARPADDLPD